MRLDARQGDTHYSIYDAKRCLEPERVIWVDTDTAQWGQLDVEASRTTRSTVTDPVQEDSITVYQDIRLIVFNEVKDEAPSDQLQIIRDRTEEIANATLYWRYKQRGDL